MSDLIFKRQLQNNSKEMKIMLVLFHFTDEKNIHFVYSPGLDLTGYGNNEEEAKNSFKIAFDDFINYTLSKKTLGKVLKDLGWKIKGSLKNPKKITAPTIGDSIKNQDYISELFDKYSIQSFHQEVSVSA